jgi:hypothetical protein
MPDNEIFEQILTELKNISGILQDMRAGSEAQHELTFSMLERIAQKLNNDSSDKENKD